MHDMAPYKTKTTVKYSIQLSYGAIPLLLRVQIYGEYFYCASK